MGEEETPIEAALPASTDAGAEKPAEEKEKEKVRHRPTSRRHRRFIDVVYIPAIITTSLAVPYLRPLPTC